jgi:hypothetical protein
MERVALLVEDTQESVRCLLNPDSLVIRRWSGVRPRTFEGNRLAGSRHRDDPLLFVGGGWTEMDIDLLFDVELAGSNLETKDVRDLTGPLRRLAENPEEPQPGARPSVVRFLWGRAWNEPCIVLAIAERLERFTAEGVPRRSWVSLRMRRVVEFVEPQPSEPGVPDSIVWPKPGDEIPEELIQVRELPPRPETLEATPALEEEAEPQQFDRPDLLSVELYGTPFLWRLFAYFGPVDDPLRLPRDRALQAPPPSAMRTGGGGG